MGQQEYDAFREQMKQWMLDHSDIYDEFEEMMNSQSDMGVQQIKAQAMTLIPEYGKLISKKINSGNADDVAEVEVAFEKANLAEELEKRLRSESIELGFKTKGSTDQIEGVRFTMNNLSFNGSKVDRQFSYSKIDYALRQNNRTEQQGLPPMQQPQHRPDHHESNTIGDSIGSLFDIPMLPNGTDPEEEAFRKRMQRKKKKGIRF